MELMDDNVHVQVHASKSYQEMDKFCWYCDKQRKLRLSCTTCCRSFHASCIKIIDKISTQIDGSKFDCPVCESLNTSKAAFVGKESDLRLLKYPMEAVLDDSDFTKLERLEGNDIINPIGLNDIKQKIDRAGYESTEEFLVDIECILHNYTISQSDNIRIATKLVEFFTSEIEHMSNCPNCYEMKYTKSNEWRTLVCDKPHLLLWVKLDHEIKSPNTPPKRGNLWPAKLLSVDDKVVNVIFFCRSELVEVPTKNCFIYNERPSTQTQKSKDFEDPQKEVDAYIESIVQKFGRFKVKSKSVRFKVCQLNRYIKDMFPDFNGELPDDVNCCESSDESVETDDNSTSSEDLESQFEDEEKYESDKDEESGEDTMSECDDEIDEALVTKLSDIDDSEPDAKESRRIQKKRHRFSGGIPMKRKRLSGPPKKRYRATMKSHKSNESSEFDDTEVSSENDNDENPNKVQHYAEENNVNYTFNPIASSTINSHNVCEINTNQNIQPPQGTKFQDEYINGRLKSRMDKRNQASLRTKNEIEKIKVDHAKEVTALNKLREDLRDRYNKQTVELYFEKQRAEAASKNLTAEHDDKVTVLRKELAELQKDKSNLCKELKACRNNSIESRDNHDRTLREIRDQHKNELESEKIRSAAAMEQLKMVHTNEVTELKNKIKSFDQDKMDLKQKHNESMLLLEQKQKTNYESNLHEIRAQFEAEKQCASEEMEKLKIEHSQQIAELERKVVTAIREKFDVEAELKRSQNCQVKHGDLIERSKAVTDDRNRTVFDAKNEVAEIKAQCANDIMRLNNMHDQATAVATARIEQLERGKDLLRKILKTSIQKLVQLDAQKQRAIAEIHKLKTTIQISQDNHSKSILELEKRLQQKIQHTIESMMDKKLVTDELKTLKVVYSKKVADLEHKVETLLKEKSLIEAKLKLKCDALNNYKLLHLQNVFSEY